MTDVPAVPSIKPRRSRLKRWSIRFAVLIVVSLIAVELFSRFYLGLGDPPLMVADSKIEYLFQPNQSCHRFHNFIHYNQWSMRSDDFPEHKSSPNELRILVIGDSVINGGSMTDQSQLATSIMQRELSEKLKRPVVVGNISAGSWGPPNEMEYLKRYGLFDADIVVIVVSTHDVVDVPTYEQSVGVRADMPDKRPWTATGELLFRYVLPRLHIRSTQLGDLPPPPDDSLNPKDVAECCDDLREMIRMAQHIHARAIVGQHFEHPEAVGTPRPGHDLLHDAAVAQNAEVVQFGPAFKSAIARGENPYRDVIHPNALGQRLIADDLEKVILESK